MFFDPAQQLLKIVYLLVIPRRISLPLKSLVKQIYERRLQNLVLNELCCNLDLYFFNMQTYRHQHEKGNYMNCLSLMHMN